MKVSRVFLILVILAVLVVILFIEGQPLPPVEHRAERPASVQTQLTEHAERLKGAILSVEKGTLKTIENEQLQEAEFYDARIAAEDGKVWRVKVLADGRVIEVDEQRTAAVELFGMRLKWPGAP